MTSIYSLTNCKVEDSSGSHEVYLIHSYDNDEVCFDNSRLNVAQTEFFPNAAFSMRTFRFNIAGSQANEEQQQTLSCNLRLNPVNAITQDQAADCSCHTESECDRTVSRASPFGEGNHALYDLAYIGYV